MSLSDITKIVTAGDGFSCNHIWPMWPHILQMTTVDTDVVCLGKLGAGNELIFNSVMDYVNQHNDVGLVLVQWTVSARLDLIVDNEVKRRIVGTDPIYSNNVFSVNDLLWWASSASKIPYVTDYHLNYIGQQQALLRTKNYIVALQAILETRRIPYVFFSAYDVECYPSNDIDWRSWAWHCPGKGIDNYSRLPKFANIRLDQVQPSPPVHLDWVLNVLRPHVDLAWETSHIEKLSELFDRGDWHGLVPHYVARSAKYN